MGMVGYCPSLCEYKVGKVIEGVKALQQLLPETVKTVAAFEIRHPPTFAGVEEGMMSQPSSHLLPNLDPGGRQTLILCAPPAVRCKADSLCYLEERGASSDELQHCARQPTKGGWAWAYIIGHVSPVKATCPWTCKPSGFSCSVQQRVCIIERR
ncbi:hypothetical protein WJX79_008793 [Trebouxia sp. C0005]